MSIPFAQQKWEFYAQQMPADIQERIRRYRKIENKYQLLIGRLLLKHGMEQLGYTDFHLEDIIYNENNCPMWKEGVHFNIAHSGNIVACAFSDEANIGIDVEQIRPIELKDFKHILNDLDYRIIENAPHFLSEFFKIWTIKEACD